MIEAKWRPSQQPPASTYHEHWCQRWFFDILKLRRDLRREAQGFGVRRPASSEGHAPAALRDGDGNGWMGALVAGESGVAATALPPQSKTRWLQSPSVDRSKRDRQVVGFQRP